MKQNNTLNTLLDKYASDIKLNNYDLIYVRQNKNLISVRYKKIKKLKNNDIVITLEAVPSFFKESHSYNIIFLEKEYLLHLISIAKSSKTLHFFNLGEEC